jgi:hypothetical protein
MFKEASLDTIIDDSCTGMMVLPRYGKQPHVSFCIHTDKVILEIEGHFWEANLQEFVEAFQKHL